MDLQHQLDDTLGTAYRIERELGGGGMARVFLADELRFKRKVVIKVLSPELTQGISAERFEREIQLAASLQQANIVPVLSAGDAAGTPYFIMPFVDGESLRARLARGALSMVEVTSILRDVARALAYAHRRGVVHRDIKPDNVLLSHGTAVVTDFGIAKALAASAGSGAGTPAVTLTQMGTSIGTPAYMAPEQVAGDPDTDHRADLYAFGCMAYELLTGRPPFVAVTPQRLLAAHLSEMPRPVSELRSDTPMNLAALVARCLEKEPAARPDSADELLSVLEAVPTGDPVRQGALADAGGGAVLVGGRAVVWRVIAVYAVAFMVVAALARAAIVGIGLPEWVFPGALVVMALGLPVILLTGYAQYVANRATPPSPTFTPGGTPSRTTRGTMATIAMKASPHLSWRRATLGGVQAVGAFVLLVAAFMLFRALGIGPAGSLLARGRFVAREPVILTDFTVQNSDAALGPVVSDAVRAGLAQSSMIALVSPAEIAAGLRRMARPPTTRLDLATAREMAQREGVKAVVDGQVTAVGSGYIVSLRLLSADSAVELASFRETGDGPRGLIDAADKLARQLRAKIGESLRSVQGSPPLARATTASFEALRQYSAGVRANSIEEDPVKAIPYARAAVALDSEFASAWRLLAVAIGNSQGSRAAADSALERAYRYSARLPDIERLQTQGMYYMHGPHLDRRRSLAVYLELIDRGDSTSAPVNAGEVLRSERAFAQADSLNMLSIRKSRGGISYGNAIEIELDQGRVNAAEKTLQAFRQNVPTGRTIPIRDMAVRYARGDVDGMARLADSLATGMDPEYKLWGQLGLANLALLHGHLNESLRLGGQAQDALAADAGARLRVLVTGAALAAWFRGPSAAGVRRLDAALDSIPLTRVPLADRPYFDVAVSYAIAGDPAKAEGVIASYRRDVTDTATLRIQAADLHNALGAIALARGNAKLAIDEFRRGDVGYDGLPARECAPCVHFNLARAFDAAGQTDSAVARYEAYIGTPYWLKSNVLGPTELDDPAVLAGTHKRLGELYEAKGDPQNAASHYAKFLELWKNADPEFQSEVAEVRKRLARLSNLETKR